MRTLAHSKNSKHYCLTKQISGDFCFKLPNIDNADVYNFPEYSDDIKTQLVFFWADKTDRAA